MRATAENSGRTSILVPLCVARFIAADGAIARFKTGSVYSRENLISEVVKSVASTNMDYALAKACASGIDLELAKAATKS
jgi:spore coat polysaccharide biosynthesis protein SpsF (cytidylyltransferase family)